MCAESLGFNFNALLDVSNDNAAKENPPDPPIILYKSQAKIKRPKDKSSDRHVQTKKQI
jgi:hypothetical protein